MAKEKEKLMFGENYKPSNTHCMKVGCGNLYITIVKHRNGHLDRVLIPRNSKYYTPDDNSDNKGFRCPEIVRDYLSRGATFGIRRDLDQSIKDLRGSIAHACNQYHVGCKAYSCQDAVAKVLKIYEKEEKELQEKEAKKT